MPNPPAITLEERAAIISDYQAGHSYLTISALRGRGVKAVAKIIGAAGLARPSARPTGWSKEQHEAKTAQALRRALS